MKKVVLITGASQGIGLATANFLIDKGLIVYGLSRRAPKTPQKYNFIEGDVTDEASIKHALEEINKKEGRLDIVINNAGMGISGASEYTTKEEIEKIFSVNVFGVFTVCNLAIPYLRKSKGQIINIGSVAGELYIPFQSYYSATKASIESYSIALRGELKPFGIRVSVVLPGDTKTNFTFNREKSEILRDEIYGDRISHSLEVMEHDEQNGMPATSVSKVIYKLTKSKNPSIVKTVGFKYKLFIFLKRIVPAKFLNYIIYKIYG
ncbi:MAG: SDR family NAD(P)-dependent oxidoreductase [Spirochaetales bacterium]